MNNLTITAIAVLLALAGAQAARGAALVSEPASARVEIVSPAT